MSPRGPRPVGPSGLLVVDKPAGWTSHDVVAKLRGVLGTRKVGHAGTLDPDATGVLLVGVGSVTRLMRFLSGTTKTYEALIAFGTETSTLDAAGEVTATHDMAGLTPQQVVAAARQFVGDIMQVPPMVSAIKIDGKRLHQLAREGIEVDRPPRPVRVTRFDLHPTEEPLVWGATIDCSSGTYIRTLAADLGTALGGGAHLQRLRRSRVGEFRLEDSVPLEKVTLDHLLTPADSLRHLDRVVVKGSLLEDIAHGKVLPSDVLNSDAVVLNVGAGPLPRSGLDAAVGVATEGPWRMVDETGALLAVYEAHKGSTIKPTVVIPPVVG